MAILNSIYVNHKNIPPAGEQRIIFEAAALARRIRRLARTFLTIKLDDKAVHPIDPLSVFRVMHAVKAK